MNKKISVIIPNFNDCRIERSIKSIIQQDYGNYELIIVDGDSTNEKLKAIYNTYEEFIKRFIQEPDNGIFDALNKGIKISTGELIYLMGSDDYLSDDKVFSSVIRKYNDSNKPDGVCINCSFINSKGKIIRDWKPRNITSKKILIGIMPPHFSLFLSKKIYDEIGYFNHSETNIGADSAWLILMAKKKKNLKIPVLKNHSIIMEYGGTSTGSIKNVLIAMKIIAQIAKKNNIKFWFLVPVIKVITKLNQFKLGAWAGRWFVSGLRSISANL